MASTDEVAAYKHLQTLVLCSNELCNIKSLSNLDSLTHLDVSGNKLANVRTWGVTVYWQRQRAGRLWQPGEATDRGTGDRRTGQTHHDTGTW